MGKNSPAEQTMYEDIVNYKTAENNILPPNNEAKWINMGSIMIDFLYFTNAYTFYVLSM